MRRRRGWICIALRNHCGHLIIPHAGIFALAAVCYTITTSLSAIMPNTSKAVVRDEEIRDRISDENSERLPAAPDTFDSKYQTTRAETWSWYVYYISNSGLTLFNFAPTAFQNLVSQAAGDTGLLHFAGR